MNKIDFTDSRLVASHVKEAIQTEDVIAVNFGNIGALVIDGMSKVANDRIIELKSMRGKKRTGPISSLLTIDSAVEYDLIDFSKIKINSEKNSKKSKIEVIKRFDGLAFKRLPLNTKSAKHLPYHLIEETEQGPSIQIFSFLGEPGELESIIRETIKQKSPVKKSKQMQMIGVTSLNFSGQSSATSNKEITKICKEMNIKSYISVTGSSPYRSGSFPIIDFTNSLKTGPTLVREGNLHYLILKQLYPDLKNACRSWLSNIMDKQNLDGVSKDIYKITLAGMERYDRLYGNDEKKFSELRNYIVNVLQEVIVQNGAKGNHS